MVNLVMSNYFLTITGLDCFLVSKDSHPNGFQRFSEALARFQLSNEAALKQQWPPEIKTLTRDTRQFAEKVALLLGCPR